MRLTKWIGLCSLILLLTACSAEERQYRNALEKYSPYGREEADRYTVMAVYDNQSKDALEKLDIAEGPGISTRQTGVFISKVALVLSDNLDEEDREEPGLDIIGEGIYERYNASPPFYAVIGNEEIKILEDWESFAQYVETVIYEGKYEVE